MKGGIDIRSILHNSKNYWRFRQLWQNTGQRLQLFSLRGSKLISHYSSSTQILLQVIRSIFPIIILSIITFVGIEKLDEPITKLVKSVAHYFGLNLHGIWLKPTEEYLASFASTAAQVAGVFLGLYYTAIGVVVSTIYAKLPQQLRLSLLRERVGNLYIVLTTALATLAFIILSLRGIGYEVGRLNYLLLCSLSLISILGFVQFGRHVFNLFDLTVILTEPYRNLINAVQRVASINRDGYDTIHAESRYEAQQALRVFEDAISVSANETFDRDKTIHSVLVFLLGSLTEYAKYKGKIATNSRWFPTVQQHRSWLTADASYIATSLNSGTPLFPFQNTDINWFESDVYRLIQRAFEILLNTENGDTYIKTFSMLGGVLTDLVEKYAVDEAVHLIQHISSAVDMYIKNHKALTSTNPNDLLPIYLAQLASMHSSLYTELIIALGKSVKMLSPVEMAKVANQILEPVESMNVRDINLPRRVRDEFNRLTDLVRFETKIEGTAVTKAWYLQQILCLAATRHIEAAITAIYQAVKGFYEKERQQPSNTVSDEYECYRMTGGIEGLGKLSYHIGLVKSAYHSFKDSRHATDIPFPIIDFDKIKTDSTQLRREILNKLIARSFSQGYKQRLPETPDFFGQAYFYCLEEARSSLRNGDEERFRQTFPTVFALALVAYGTVEKELKEQSDETRTIFATESLEDIMCLSGLAFIYSELNNKNFSSTVEEVWNKHLKTLSNRSMFIGFLLATISYRKGTFSLKPRDILRGVWDQELTHEFRQHGLINNAFGLNSLQHSQSQKHSSKLIQVLIQSSFPNVIETFVCLYLLKQPESAGIELHPLIKSFRDSLERIDNED